MLCVVRQDTLQVHSHVLDTDMMATIKAEEEDLVNAKKAIEAAFMGIGPADDPCAVSNLAIESNVANLNCRHGNYGCRL